MTLASRIITLMLAMAMVGSACAQEWLKVNVHESNYDFEWSFPYEADHFSHFDFSANGKELRAHRVDEQDGVANYVSFNVSSVDSITFADELPEAEQTHNKYQVYALNITTDGSVGVQSKEDYVNCYISLDGGNGYNMYSGTGRIRGRGNSTWEWYDKKPYRIKLDKKHKMLGLDSNKDWVLLANYRDVTDLMNTFMFEVARWMGMPFCNHTRYVELFLDGEYRGLYQLTEQVEQGKSRVNIADDGGILLAMDLDDGPSLSPDATDNFWSSVYNMPMAVKYPDDVDAQTKDSIQTLLAQLETVISNADYDALDSLMDMRSFMTMALLQEYSYNVEIAAPRSIFMYKDADGKWAMGPFWDWDAGFDFDWSDMYTGHHFFDSYSISLLGTDPANRRGTRSGVPRYFTDMFKSDRYTREFKALWNSVKDSIFTRNWTEMELYIAQLSQGAYARDMQRWPITYQTSGGGWGWGGWGGQTVSYVVADEIEKMRTWLEGRTAYLDGVINNYPQTGTEGDDDGTLKYGILNTYISGTNLDIYVNMSQTDNYSQADHIEIDPSTLAGMLGLSDNEINNARVSLTPLNSNGTTGNSTAQGTWGAWYNAAGNVVDWGGNAHVFIEPRNTSTSNVYSWNYGCHPDNCRSGEQHTARMRYSITIGGQTSYITVTVHFGIDCIPAGTYENMNVDPSLYSWRNMQSVGEETISRTYNLGTVNAYDKQKISINLQDIQAKFPAGATVNDLKFMTCTDIKTGELISTLTSSNGFYMMFDGTAVKWGESECKIGYTWSDSTLDFAYTADIERPASGSQCTASVFLVYSDKYYYRFRFNVELI